VKLVTNQEYAVKVSKCLLIIARERYCHLMGYILVGMCCCGGYGFQAVWSKIGYRNQRV